MIIALIVAVSWAVLARQERLHRAERMNFLTVAQRREEEIRPAKDLADVGLLLAVAVTIAEITGLILWSAFGMNSKMPSDSPMMRDAVIQQFILGAVCLGTTLALLGIGIAALVKNIRYRRWQRMHPGGPLDE